MQHPEAMQRFCGAKLKKPNRKGSSRCERPPGWNTPHKGRGPCSYHLGNTTNVVRHHARAEAMEFVAGQLGAELPVDPLDAAVKAVGLAYGAVEYWRVELADAVRDEREPTPTVIEGYRLALTDLARVTKLANDAGVADRLAQISARMAEQLTLALEEALGAIKADAEQRTIVAKVFGDAIERLEGQGARQPVGLLDAA